MISRPLITVAVATCNRHDVLKLALASLVALDTDGLFDYQILVIDNGSTDDTPSMVQSFPTGNALAIRFSTEPTRGLPFVRNRAVREFNGDWLAFFDDDQLADKRWLVRLYVSATEQNADFAGGARSLNLLVSEPVKLSPVSRRLLGEVSHQMPQPYHAKFLPSTGNALIHRRVFDHVPGFDTAVIDGGEDCDFFSRVIQCNLRGHYDPTAIVQHLISSNRLEPSYLRWIAYRHGIHVGRRDVKQHGKLKSAAIAVARCTHAAITVLPRWTLANITRNAPARIGLSCLYRRTRGYVDYVCSQWSGSAMAQQRLEERARHHGVR